MGSENAAAPTRVVGYTRVSRREQAVRGISLEAQRAALETECRRRGWELVALHEDAGRSGKRLNGRPGVNAALADVRAGRADVLLVVRVDRLSRSTLDLCQLAEEMRTRRRVRRGSYLPPWSLVSLAEGDTDVMSAAGEHVTSR